MAKTSKVSARNLFAKLGAAGASDHVFTGMIKPQTGNDRSLLFARRGDCSRWVEIPVSQISDVEFVQLAHCGEHTHPLVHLVMKNPRSDQAVAFAALARLHQPPVPLGNGPNAVHAALAPGATPCYWDWQLNRWICPP